MKNYCDNCKVKTRAHLHNCPLCGKHIDGEHDPADPCAYPKPDLQYYHNIKIAQIINILLALGTVVCLIIDLFFTRSWWSAYVAASCLLIYLVVVYPVNRKIFYWKEVFINITVIFLYVLFIDGMTDFTMTWSVTFIIPIVCAAFAVIVSIIILASRNKSPAESLLALVIVFLFSLVFFLVSALVFTRVITEYSIIPAFIALVVSFVCLAGMAMFRFREFVKELFKKFRF